MHVEYCIYFCWFVMPVVLALLFKEYVLAMLSGICNEFLLLNPLSLWTSLFLLLRSSAWRSLDHCVEI